MTEDTGMVTMGGNPVTLIGKGIKVGDKAPDFTFYLTTRMPISARLTDY